MSCALYDHSLTIKQHLTDRNVELSRVTKCAVGGRDCQNRRWGERDEGLRSCGVLFSIRSLCWGLSETGTPMISCVLVMQGTDIHTYTPHTESHTSSRELSSSRKLSREGQAVKVVLIFICHYIIISWNLEVFSALQCLTPATLNLPQQRGVWRKPLSLVSCSQTHLTTGFLSCCRTVWIF